MIKLSPSILAADPLQMGSALQTIKQAKADELHFDVMDAHFVPNLSFGPSLLEAMKPYLSEKRRAKMDKAIKIAGLARIARLAMGEMGDTDV